MCIAPNGYYTASEFDADLDQFESATGCDRVFVIYEACYSGSFLDDLSKSNRIIITSTDAYNSAWWSPIAPHISLFGESFFTSVQAGNSMGVAVVDATADLEALGYGDLQFPCIEDNHDGTGHSANAWGWFPSTDDGHDALNTYICTNCPSTNIILPIFLKIPIKKWLVNDFNPLMFPVQVQIQNMTPTSVECRIIPANWTPPAPTDNESMGGWDPSITSQTLTYYGNGNYSGLVEILTPINNTDYRLSFIVEDTDGNRGRVESTLVGLNENGTAPSDTTNPDLYITNPASGASVSGTVDITAKGDDDQELDNITIYFDGVLVNTTTMTGYLPYSDAVFTCDTTAYDNGVHNITATATDKTGNTNTTSILFNIHNVAGIPGFQLTPVILGCFLVVLTIQTLKNKKRELVFP